MGLGALDGYEIEGEELSYEGPFGVGYLVARLKRGRVQPQRKLGEALIRDRENKLQESRSKEAYLVRLARQSISHYLSTGGFLKIPPQPGEEEKKILAAKAGAFVSLKKHGRLRGCIGTIEPTRNNLQQEIIHNAVSAAFHDPRFDPLEPEEMDELTVSVDVLGQPEQISSLEELDTRVYGVIVSKGSRRGLLLPDLPGIDSPAEQVRMAREKAGIGPDEGVVLERFKVTRYT
jgi:AmmeMemoRadiSam system protein A